MNLQGYQEASDWLVRQRIGALNPQERRAFDSWLRQSPQHVRAYLEVSAIWEDVALLEAQANEGPDELIAIACSDDNIQPLGHRPTRDSLALDCLSKPSGRFNHLRNVWKWVKSTMSVEGPSSKRVALALTVLVVAGLSTTWVLWQHEIYSTGSDEQRSVVLEDGSTVELNSHSRIQVRVSQDKREVELLGGEALFSVVHDRRRPFVVRVGTADVRAVGTQFDVYRRLDEAVVTVVQGRVAVLTGDREAKGYSAIRALSGLLFKSYRTEASSTPALARNPILVGAGQQLKVARLMLTQADVKTSPPTPVDVAAATAWTRHALVFDSTTLMKVAQEFNRYSTRRIVIQDADVGNFRISGVFSSADPNVLIRFLRSQPEIRVEEVGQEIFVKRR
jgi:transmembrane sensor